MRTLFLVTALLFCRVLFSQDGISNTKASNEIKLNIAYSLIGIPEIAYERIISNESSVGASLAFSLESDIDYKFGITPYYRFFFGRKRANGFFIEANTSIYTREVYKTSSLGTEKKSNETGIGLGTALGGKFLTKGGWIGEIYGGFGRNLGNIEELDWGYPRFGFIVGKQF